MNKDDERYARADEAALDTYFRLRTAGQAHQRALSAAIVRLISTGAAHDGREARARMIVGLRSRGIVPADREDWIRTAVSSEAWRWGARAAVERLSAECRRPFPDARELAPVAEREMVIAAMIAQYLRQQMPAKIARLRREAMRLFAEPAGSAH